MWQEFDGLFTDPELANIIYVHDKIYMSIVNINYQRFIKVMNVKLEECKQTLLMNGGQIIKFHHY